MVTVLRWFSVSNLLVWLNRNFWMIRKYNVRQPVQARMPGMRKTPTNVHGVYPNYLTCGLSSRRQAPVESESLSEICDPVPDARGGVPV